MRSNKPRRSRPRRSKGGGVSPPSRSKPQSRWDEVGKRIDVSYDVIGHPQQASRPVEEGKHYKTLAYTDWADTFIPTVVKWNHGAVDSFGDPAKSRENQRKALALERERNLKRAVTEMKKAAKEEKEKYGKPGPMTLKDLRYYQFELKKEREKRRKLKPDTRGTAREGDRVACSWFDDPKYITGTVKRDGEGLYIETPNGRGYLNDAHHVTKASGMSQRIKLPVGGGTLKVRGKEYIWRTGDRSYKAAQEKAEDLRKQGNKAVLRKERVAGKPTYVVYVRKEGAN